MKKTNDSLFDGVTGSDRGLRRIAYAGTFDPMTKGHLDLIERGLKLCDELIVVVIDNQSKKVHVPLADRIRMVELTVQDYRELRSAAGRACFPTFAAGNISKFAYAACVHHLISSQKNSWHA